MSDQPLFVPETDNWFVLRTKSRYEKKLATSFTKHGIEFFLPLKMELKQWSDRMKKVESPLFPGFIFVQMTETTRFQILNTPGAVQFLYHDKKYAQLTRRDIEMINLALDDRQELEVIGTELIEGQIVNINSGPFKGFEAKLIHQNGKGKLILEISSIGQGVVVEIGNAKIVPKHS